MVACVPASTNEVASVHLTVVPEEGSTTEHSPESFPFWFLASNPKAILSVLEGFWNWPPPLACPGVEAGGSHALVAGRAAGSPPSWTPLPLVSAKAEIRSAPASWGPV